MSDLRTFNSSDPAELQHRLDEFVGRCDAVMQFVLHKRFDERQIFTDWLRALIAESANPFWILHEDPLYMVADYLNLDVASVETGPIASDYLRLAQQRNW